MHSPSTSRFLNDGTLEAPKLRVFLNLDNLLDLRSGTKWTGLLGDARDAKLLADGFEGIQLTGEEPAPASGGIPYCGLDRISTPEEADGVAARHAQRGDLCISVHAGWGLEDDDAVDRLVEAILKASERHDLPIFIETHRATITQDLWRTVRITNRFPEVRFNGDFSHYYCGQEMVYGDWEQKMNFMEPIFSRIAFMHGRIASPGCMQVPIDEDLSARPAQAHGVIDYLQHFKELWTRSMRGFLRHARPGDVLIFAPELLSGTYYYARLFPDAEGCMHEESDRYSQALLYARVARSCFKDASSA